jgi:hypothetical protein
MTEAAIPTVLPRRRGAPRQPSETTHALVRAEKSPARGTQTRGEGRAWAGGQELSAPNGETRPALHLFHSLGSARSTPCVDAGAGDALFPQDRIGFLVLLAVWGGICAFAATVRRNFASYSAALAGYTAAIIAADTLGATGASPLGRSLRFRQSRRCRNLSMRNRQWRRKKPLALTRHRWPSAAVKERSGKSRRFARTSWWWTQSLQTGLRRAARKVLGFHGTPLHV